MPIINRRCNEQIRISPVRLIDESGTIIGEVSTNIAMERAREAGMDLVEVDPNSRPPVCKIMDYGKFKYRESKKKQKHHEQKLKEVRLRPKTDPHDRSIKVNHAKEFLAKGDKVQFTMVFKGRERAHPQMAMEIFNAILADLEGVAKVERPAKLEGRRMTMVVMPGMLKPVGKPQPAGGAGGAAKPPPARPAPVPAAAVSAAPPA